MGKYGVGYFVLALAAILYGAAVFTLREKGYQGIVLGMLWLFFLTAFYLFADSTKTVLVFQFLLIGAMVLCVSALKGWFGVSKGKGLLAILGGFLTVMTVPFISIP